MADTSAAGRRKAAANGHALPDGSFPIENRKDVADAIRLIGHAKDKAAARRHIIKRARALGAMDLIPKAWLS